LGTWKKGIGDWGWGQIITVLSNDATRRESQKEGGGMGLMLLLMAGGIAESTREGAMDERMLAYVVDAEGRLAALLGK
jgi:hypothetical protein